MHAAMLIDTERLMREHAMLNRLTVGLIDEGARITRIVPEGVDSESDDERPVGLVQRVEYSPRVLPWMKVSRARRIGDLLEKSPPEILHVVGTGAWRLGLQLSRRLSVPLTIDIYGVHQVRRAPRPEWAAHLGAYIAATTSLGERLQRRFPPELVGIVPMGVSVPQHAPMPLGRAQDSVAIAAIGRCRDLASYKAMLGGVARVAAEFPQVHVFLELDGPLEHRIWREAKSHRLLSRLSTFTNASAHRSLVSRCDILLMPERTGEVRSLLLEAMAAGMPVVAHRDPSLDMLVPGETAITLTRPGADAWHQEVRRLLIEPGVAAKLGAAARDRIARCHRSSEQGRGLYTIFERVLTGGAYPFETAQLGARPR